MSNNVVDFPNANRSRNKEAEAKKSRERRQEHVHRLSSAARIEDQLRNTYRTELSDRARMSENLWRYWEIEKKRGRVQSLSKIFEEAFGEHYDAKYKKRARFMRPVSETASDGFSASGADYVDLAKAIARLASEGQSPELVAETSNQAIIKLIEGTSFDDERSPSTRRLDEGINFLTRSIESVAQQVESTVDLDILYSAVKLKTTYFETDDFGNPVGLRSTWHRYPRLDVEAVKSFLEIQKERLDLLDTSFSYRLAMNIDSDFNDFNQAWSLWKENEDRALTDNLPAGRDLNRNCSVVHLGDIEAPTKPSYEILDDPMSLFAPRVKIADYFTLADLDIEGVGINVDYDTFDENYEKQKATFEQLAAKYSRFGLQPNFDERRVYERVMRDQVIRALAEEWNIPDAFDEDGDLQLCDIPNSDQGVEFDSEWFTFHRDGNRYAKQVRVAFRYDVFVELLFDPISEHWKPCITISSQHQTDFMRDDVLYICDSNEFIPLKSLGLTDSTQHAFLSDDTLVLAEDFSLGPSLDSKDFSQAKLPFFSEASLSLLKQPLGDDINKSDVISPLLEFPADQYAPFEANTLAGVILRNLAYAPVENRLDTLLKKDALAKNHLAEKNLNEAKHAFKTGLSWISE